MHATAQSRRMPTLVWVLAAFVVAGSVGPSGLIFGRRPDVDPAPVAPEGPPPVVDAASPTPPQMPQIPRPSLIPATPSPALLTLPPARECRYADELAGPGPDGDWALALVDTALRLPGGWVPPDLGSTADAGIKGGGQIRTAVIADLEGMTRAAKAAKVPLVVRSAYRSESRQRKVFAEWAAQVGEKKALRVSARPGHSEHQLGTTIDFARGPVAPWTESFDKTPTGRWLALHAAEFGFVMSYPEGAFATTCYDYEPWHFRWIGREHAAAVVASGLTLREWLLFGTR